MQRDEHPRARRAAGIALLVALTGTSLGCAPGTARIDTFPRHATRDGLPALIALREDPVRDCRASCFTALLRLRVATPPEGLRLAPRPVAWPRLR